MGERRISWLIFKRVGVWRIIYMSSRVKLGHVREFTYAFPMSRSLYSRYSPIDILVSLTLSVWATMSS